MRRYLDATKKGEHDEGHEQAEDGHGASDVGDDRQRRLVAGIQISRVEILQNGKIGQVIGHRVRLVGGQHPAALVAPCADRVVPEDARRVGTFMKHTNKSRKWHLSYQSEIQVN